MIFIESCVLCFNGLNPSVVRLRFVDLTNTNNTHDFSRLTKRIKLIKTLHEIDMFIRFLIYTTQRELNNRIKNLSWKQHMLNELHNFHFICEMHLMAFSPLFCFYFLLIWKSSSWTSQFCSEMKKKTRAKTSCITDKWWKKRESAKNSPRI